MNFLKHWIVRKEVTSAVDGAIKESHMAPAIKAWLIGAANALISGATAGGIGDGLGLSTKKAILLGLGAGAISLLKWMKQHPIPGGTQ